MPNITFETEEDRLRELIGRLYQLAGQVVMSDQPDEDLEILLLDVLSDPDGEAAQKLLSEIVVH